MGKKANFGLLLKIAITQKQRKVSNLPLISVKGRLTGRQNQDSNTSALISMSNALPPEP